MSIHWRKRKWTQMWTLLLLFGLLPIRSGQWVISWMVFCCCWVAQLCLALCSPVECCTPGFPVLHCYLPEFVQTHVHHVGDAIQPSHHLLSPSPPTFNLSRHQGLFQGVSSWHQVTKYWSFSFNISPSNEYSRLISFRMDWLDLLVVQGTLKSLLQHHVSKASILWCWAL